MKSTRLQLFLLNALLVVLLLGLQQDCKQLLSTPSLDQELRTDAPVLIANLEERALNKEKQEKSNSPQPAFQFPNIFDALRLIF